MATNSKKRCPDCKVRLLNSIQYQKMELDLCQKCGGLWFDKRELHIAIQKDDAGYEIGKTVHLNSSSYLIGETAHKCPDCLTTLDRHQFSRDIRTHYNICKSCEGIWLESGHFRLIKHSPNAQRQKLNIEAQNTFGHKLFQFFFGMPIEFNIKPHTMPIITSALIILNLLVFALSASNGLAEIFSNYAFIPANTTSLLDHLKSFNTLFLHSGLGHLTGNMYFLWIFGDSVEDAFGHLGYLTFYLIGGIISVYTFYLFSPDTTVPLVGASGAVSAIGGSYLVLFRKAKLTLMFFIFQWKVRAWIMIVLWILFNLVGFLFKLGNVAWDAHLGGFFFGVVITLIFYKKIMDKNPTIKLINHHTN